MAQRRGSPATLCESTLLDKSVVLRPARLADAYTWREIRIRNADWLRPWEETEPEKSLYQCSLGSYLLALAEMRRQHLRRQGLHWVITFGDELVGQLAVTRIVYGSYRSGMISYWIDRRFAGYGIVPTALAMAVDYSFQVVGLYRLEAAIQPENHSSRRVIEKLGFREEGMLRGWGHVNGAWRNFLCYALTAEDVSDPLMTKWRSSVRKHSVP